MKADSSFGDYRETEIGFLPKEWAVKKLGDIANFKNGINFNANQKGKTGVLTVDVLNMYSKNIFVNLKSLYRIDKKVNQCYLLKKGNILFVRSSLKREGVGWTTMVKEIEEPVTFCGFIIRAELKTNEVYPEFLTYFLRTAPARANLISQSGKVTITNINQGMLGMIPLPIPPYLEQKEIVFALSTIQSAQEKSDNVLSSLKELKKSLMKHLFTYGAVSLEDSEKVVLKETEIGEVPEKWLIAKLSSIFRLTSGKERPKDIAPNKTGSNIYPVYGGNGIMGYSKEKLLDKNTIIIGRVGEYCGASYFSKEDCWVSDNALYSKELLLSVNLDYLCMALKKLDLNRLKNTGGQPLISQSIVYSQSIPLPSNQEQEEIAKTISVVDSAIEAEQRKIKSLDNLFKSMLSNLMSAKIRVTQLED